MAENAFAKAVRTFAGADEDDVFRHEEVAGLGSCTHDGSLFVFWPSEKFQTALLLDFFLSPAFFLGRIKRILRPLG